MSDEIFRCPECGGDELLVYSETSYNLNTGDFYCVSVKHFDACAKVSCQHWSCSWVGTLSDVKEGKK